MNHCDQSKSEPSGRRDEPGPGDDVRCVNCNEPALDTGLECDNCGFDNFEAVTGRPFYPATQAAAPAPTLTERLQQRCSDWGAYWRAPDAHGVMLSAEQATELLRDALSVEVEIVEPTMLNGLTEAETSATASVAGLSCAPTEHSSALTEMDMEQLRDLTVAVGELSTAMGSPCVFGKHPATILSATVRLAAHRLIERAASTAVLSPVVKESLTAEAAGLRPMALALAFLRAFEAEALLLERESVGIIVSEETYFKASAETSRLAHAFRKSLPAEADVPDGVAVRSAADEAAYDVFRHRPVTGPFYEENGALKTAWFAGLEYGRGRSA